ncbi:MAG: exodeoxyribonuclease VII large subunit [Bdellovibrionaceae bacterium]|nr:exodeoxyribonuclease VII large subunit [Pseudobdellovibrionaceae bacterium]
MSLPEESAEEKIFSVSDINGLLKAQIEKNFSSVWIRGEISNFKAHTSGHFYFSLKDERSQINAVMFKGFNARLKFRPESGMEVMVRGRITVYEPRGTYQIFCESMEPVGAGALQKAFEQLKEKLRLEGLFAPEHKKALPLLPKHIGIVTSPTGAAIQDILNVLSRRYRGAEITIIPARVQGDGAAQEVVRGIELANRLDLFDVLIVGRGGGSIEDLWCFNEEIVARAIFKSHIPIISAVGHEIDFTIADFVADYRAPTPSAAAEVVAKSASEIKEKILALEQRLQRGVKIFIEKRKMGIGALQKQLVDPKRRLEDLALRCDELTQRLSMAWTRYHSEKVLRVQVMQGRLQSPRTMVSTKRAQVVSARRMLQQEMQTQLLRARDRVQKSIGMLDGLSPLKVLGRGYSIMFHEDKAVRSVKDVVKNDELTVRLHDGELVTVVKDKKNKK